MRDLSIGTSVDARFKTNGAFYSGKIKQMNTDGTYDITFDDKRYFRTSFRKNTPLKEMKYNE